MAAPSLDDPNFSRTVILMLEHGDEGALGLVLNRPSELDLDVPLPGWAAPAASPAVVFVGGPVAPGAALCLARFRAGSEGGLPLLDRVGTMDLNGDPDEVVAEVEQLRVFAGYAGWGPGQLEAEILTGSWLVVDAADDDALSPDPERLWHAVLRRQKGRLALLANFPLDPAAN